MFQRPSPDRQDLRGHQGNKAHRVYPVSRVVTASEGLVACRASKESRGLEPQAQSDPPVESDRQAHRVLRAKSDLPARQASQAIPGYRGLLAPQVLQGLPVVLVHLALLVLQDLRGLKVSLGRPVVLLVHPVHLANQAPEVGLEAMAHRASRVL